MERVKVEEEEVVIVGGGGGDGDGGGGGGGDGGDGNGSSLSSSSFSSQALTPQPMEGLHDAGPPPFLTKTYEMVEDTSTDSIVSWSRVRNSFIVWDSNKFSTTLLPRYFKHSNFSSFIRQLNTYGFRKVDPDRWEFASEGFLGGQKHLLKTIKRRRHVTHNIQQQRGGGPAGPCVQLGKYSLEAERDGLRRDRNILMLEIVKLRQQQQSSRNQLVTIQERLQGTERKQQQMMAFLSRALKYPSFMQQLIQRNEQGRQLGNGGIGKKRRLPPTRSAAENLQDETTSRAVAAEAMRNPQFASFVGQAQEEVPTVESDIETLFSAAIDNGSSSGIQGEMGDVIPSNSSTDLDTGVGDLAWEELLNEDLIAGEEDGDVGQSEIDVEVEELVAQPANWGGNVEDLIVEQMGYLTSDEAGLDGLKVAGSWL